MRGAQLWSERKRRKKLQLKHRKTGAFIWSFICKVMVLQNTVRKRIGKGDEKMDFNEIVKKDLEFLRKQLAGSKNELAKLPKETLWIEERKKGELFFSVSGDKGERKRKLISKDPDLISKLVRKEYLVNEVEIIERDIETLEKMKRIYTNGYVEPVAANVIKTINKARHRNTYEKYCRSEVERAGKPPIDYKRYSKEIIEWALADYNRSDYRPEDLRHRSSHGLFVRSKSEITIVEKYYEYKIPSRYEEVIERDGIRVIPDFIVPDRYGNFWIWEHCGMPNNPEYLARHKRKIEIYEKMGIVPWKNLIVTYDNEYGSIDVKIIEAEIKGKLL
ncbi:MAG: hypothetical protein E7225_03495 [Clostridiales bacterium]|nr:hypothetical protein [Clostridiales bacterium]